ncbi:Bug family tripartite tricarboxylate transporter substrate binding protein [Advenella kashmirensis]
MQFRLPLRALILSITACAATLPSLAFAQNDTIKIVVGYPAGGILDALARAVADAYRKAGNGQAYVENKPGASTMMAAMEVARARPDGHTVLLSHSMPFTSYPFTYAKLNYSPDDLVPVANLANVPIVISTGSQRPYKTIQEYLAAVKTDPTLGTVGLAGLGGPTHFGLMEMAKNQNIKLEAASYSGGPQLVNDEMGGHVPLGMDAAGAQMELYRAGKIRFLGLGGTQPVSFLPGVKTLHEQGIKGLENVKIWYGAYVPKGTPPEVAAKLEKAFIAVVKDPEMKKNFEKLGLELTGESAASMQSLLDHEKKVWEPIVKESGFKAN